ncbi:hypothetical protein FI667_g2201, partial [Globisporangium splendens]
MAKAMTTTTTMRLAPRSTAVESFLRNFERERVHEVLEVALCYGVFCLAQNFSLKGVSVEELRAITKYEVIKKRDFFVRNAGISLRRGGRSDAAIMRVDDVNPLHVKPSHSWRDGDDKTATQLLGESENRDVKMLPSSKQLVSLETSEVAAEGKPFDEIDFFTTLFGKPFVDTAWTTFTARNGSQIISKDALRDKFTKVDQRKVAARFPSLELPVSSFVEFLSEYVKMCVGCTTTNGDGAGVDAAVEDMESDDDMLFREKENMRVNGGLKPRQRDISSVADSTRTLVRESGVMGPGKPQRARQTSPQVPQSSPRPRSLQHVQSKVKPELDARRDKMLRVKKTQTQLMKESLARTRLAEYEAKKLLDEAMTGTASFQRSARKMPLSEITTGAAALEIADSFMKSPLLDTFNRRDAKDDSTASRVNATTAAATRDPLRDELYGATPLDDAFLGCKPSPVPARRNPPTRRKSNRVLPVWVPGDENDESDEGDTKHHQTSHRHGEAETFSDCIVSVSHKCPRAFFFAGRSASSPKNKFEWNFDRIDAENRKQQRSQATDHVGRNKQSEDDRSSLFSTEDKELDAVSDDYLSDDLRSEVSDPVFKWLKQVV